jgi:hypothetical protein
MSFVAWLALPVVVTLIATVIMAIAGRTPHTDTHQDIESFARFRGALERQTARAERRPTRERQIVLERRTAAERAARAAAESPSQPGA